MSFIKDNAIAFNRISTFVGLQPRYLWEYHYYMDSMYNLGCNFNKKKVKEGKAFNFSFL